MPALVYAMMDHLLRKVLGTLLSSIFVCARINKAAL